MKKEYIQPNVKEIKVSTIDNMLAGSPELNEKVTDGEQLGKEDEMDFDW